jgi:hypothetical protein
MISCFMLGDNFFCETKKFQDFNIIIDELNDSRGTIYACPTGAIVEIINEYSKRLSKNRRLLNYEGVPFLVLWLKKKNIKRLLHLNFEKQEYLDDFIQIEDSKFMKAQPKGIVCHFMAGNVPTLAIYYLIQSLLCKNVNLIRVPSENINIVVEILKPLLDITVNFEGIDYYGKTLLKSTSLLYFPSKDAEFNTEMSLLADVRVICGGEEAVNTLSSLPKKTTCKDVIFGPKYSFAVFEKSAMESSTLPKYFDAFANDIISFDQRACSSPQILFVEKSSISIKESAYALEESLEKLSKRYTKNAITKDALSKIINKRGEYLLSLDKDIICSNDLRFTILIDKDVKLEEPIQYRTIYLKEVEDIFQICTLITPRIQTIGIASEDKNRIMNFANRVGLKGVDRLVKVGLMNLYDDPWDGMLFMSEIVKWTVLNLK